MCLLSSRQLGPRTLHNITELELQTKAVQDLIRYRTQSPPSLTIQAVNQLIKGCEIAIHSTTILAAQIKKLRAANKKVRKKSYVGRGVF